MPKFERPRGILALIFLITWVGACRSWQKASPTQEALAYAKDWKSFQQEKLAAQQKYLSEHAEEASAFRSQPLGYDGLPAILFGILSETSPEIWAEDPAHQLMGLTFTGEQDGRLPYEFHLGNGSDQGPKIAALSCGSCHIGRVMDSQGLTTEIFGAPNTQIDTTALRYFLWQTVNDERLSASRVTNILHDKPEGWFYGKDQKAEELRDRQMILANPDVFLTRIKQSLNAREALINRGLGEHTYRQAKDLLRGGVPGSLDAFGFTVLSLVVGPKVKDRGILDLADADLAMLPPNPPMVDIMSVWQQSLKPYAQWDGTIKNPLMRNIGAELGVIRDPAKVDRRNATMTTALVADLPSVPYPFEVDMVKAASGAVIYQNVCSKCHDHNLFVDVHVLGVDANRAKGLNAPARLGLIKGLKAACGDVTDSRCNVPDDEVLRDRSDHPGYQAPNLAGIWARAPYLHNGSIPTLFHLLVPRQRPQEFVRGDIRFDRTRVGFLSEIGLAEGKTVDTRWPGFNNRGHEEPNIFFGGIDFERDDAARESLVEYLKTL